MNNYPATPTPWPPGDPAPLDLSSWDIGLWQSTDVAINYWNYYPQFGQVLQLIMLALLIFYIVRLLAGLIGRYLASRAAEGGGE